MRTEFPLHMTRMYYNEIKRLVMHGDSRFKKLGLPLTRAKGKNKPRSPRRRKTRVIDEEQRAKDEQKTRTQILKLIGSKSGLYEAIND